MSFRIDLNAVVKKKVDRARQEVALDLAARLFWRDLKEALEAISKTAAEIGEPVYDFKHTPFQSRLALRGFVGIQFAVSEEHQLVLVQHVALGTNHPYPQPLEEIFNQEPS